VTSGLEACETLGGYRGFVAIRSRDAQSGIAKIAEIAKEL